MNSNDAQRGFIALTVIGKKAVEIATEKGWLFTDLNREILLMHCELSKAVEGHRINNPPSEHIPQYSVIEEEFADAIIRILGSAEARGMDVPGAVFAKMEFNRTRPFRHGGKNY